MPYELSFAKCKENALLEVDLGKKDSLGGNYKMPFVMEFCDALYCLFLYSEEIS